MELRKLKVNIYMNFRLMNNAYYTQKKMLPCEKTCNNPSSEHARRLLSAHPSCTYLLTKGWN